MKTMRKSLRLISCAVLGAAILAPTLVGKDHAEADSYYGRRYSYNYTYNPWYEKATLFYTKFIKCFLLRADSLSDWGLVVKTAVNAMMIPPVNVVLCFKD